MTNTSENNSKIKKNEQIDKVNSHTKNLKIINNFILLLIILGAWALIYFVKF